MPEHDDQHPQPQPDPTSEDAADDGKVLDDLDPEEEDAAGVEGGARYGRWGRL